MVENSLRGAMRFDSIARLRSANAHKRREIAGFPVVAIVPRWAKSAAVMSHARLDQEAVELRVAHVYACDAQPMFVAAVKRQDKAMSR